MLDLVLVIYVLKCLNMFEYEIVVILIIDEKKGENS